MAAITHTEIAQRMRELADIDTPAAQRERASLIELCAGIGHAHKPQWPYLNKSGPCIGCGKKAG